ncbi:DUF1456 family protein [Proteus myxofaciens]|uniref:Cytoplasmic protein n=1 Tax=Proteus myxofaciens ATCC 19692 TaxID=1354337 RepID=A0A198FHD8_9GAMM|nr:DUF1456 family protein [Proteus myxofaciens]OAT24303.1 hypothetical protein M983_2607 [Proteus myxofaciens ATCC 19692]
MQNNYVLRSVRYMLDLSDGHVVQIMKLADLTVTKEQVNHWLKKDDEPEFVECDDNTMGHFLNGLVFYRRGKDESHPVPEVEKRITNNIILKKLRVAFELKDVDMIEIYKRADFNVSKPELSAIFRKPGHKNYRNCGDQLLRYFLKGLTVTLRGDGTSKVAKK